MHYNSLEKLVTSQNKPAKRHVCHAYNWERQMPCTARSKMQGTARGWESWFSEGDVTSRASSFASTKSQPEKQAQVPYEQGVWVWYGARAAVWYQL